MKPFAKIAAIIASAALALSALGCSSAPAASQPAGPDFDVQDIQVSNPGYAITDEGKLRYAFVAVNPNEGHVAQEVIFTVEAHDANGSMIAGGGETIAALYPGVETPGSGEVDLFSPDTDNPEVANLTIVAMMDSVVWADTTLSNADIEGAIDIVSPRMAPGDDGSLSIMATIGMKSDDGDSGLASMEARAVAVLFDESGNALCGTSPVTFALSKDGEDYAFEASIPNAPEYKECNLYVTPNALV